TICVRAGVAVTVKRSRKRAPRRRPARPKGGTRISRLELQEIEALREDLERMKTAPPPRWNADPEDVRRSVGKLVLTLVDFIRQILERQAIRRMDAGTLTAEETEAVGLALMRLEETIRDLAAQFGLDVSELKLDLGPVGRLT